MLHGGSLLKPPCQRMGRHSFVEGIRNGGLDFLKAAVGVFRHGDYLLDDGFFSLPSSGRLLNYYVSLFCPPKVQTAVSE